MMTSSAAPRIQIGAKSRIFWPVFFVLLGFALALTGPTLVHHRAADPFFYNSMDDALRAAEGKPLTRNMDGYIGIVAMLLSATGSDPSVAIALPTGILLLPLAFAATLGRLAPKGWVVALFCFGVSFDLAHALTNGTMFAYGWTRYLFVIVVLILVCGAPAASRSWRWIALLLVIYAGMTLIHYTAPYWSILLFLGFVYVGNFEGWRQHRWTATILLGTIYIVTYIEQQVTRRIIQTVSEGEFSIGQKAIQLFERLRALALGQGRPESDPLLFQPPAIVFGVSLTLFVIALAAWFGLVLTLIRRKSARSDIAIVLPVILGGVSILHGLTYGLIVGLRVDEIFVLLLPVFVLPYASYPVGRKIVPGIAVASILLLALQSTGYYGTFARDSDVPELLSVHEWATDELGESQIVADGALQYQLGFVDQLRDNSVATAKLTRPQFDALVRSHDPGEAVGVLLVNVRSDQTVVLESPRLRGFGDFEQELNELTSFDRIMDAGGFAAYARTNTSD